MSIAGYASAATVAECATYTTKTPRLAILTILPESAGNQKSPHGELPVVSKSRVEIIPILGRAIDMHC